MMEKRAGLVGAFILVALINFVSAASFSLSDALGNIPESTLIIFLVFVLSFSILFFALNRAFKDNRAIAAVISFALSFGITYWVNKSGFDLQGWFYDIGISEEILSVLIPILIIALAVFLIIKLKKNSLLIFGGLFLISAIFVYEKTIMLVIGVVLIIIRLLLWRKNGGKGEKGKYPWYPWYPWGYGPPESSSGSGGRAERNPRTKHYLKRLYKKKQRELRNLSPLRRKSRYNAMAASIKDELREIERRLGMS